MPSIALIPRAGLLECPERPVSRSDALVHPNRHQSGRLADHGVSGARTAEFHQPLRAVHRALLVGRRQQHQRATQRGLDE
jgi:hypothetical protein